MYGYPRRHGWADIERVPRRHFGRRADRPSTTSRDVGALDALEVLEVGEGAGGLELLVNQDLVLRRLDLVEHGRSIAGAADFSVVRSLLSTAKKQAGICSKFSPQNQHA
jgi:hypothetical protein